MNYAVLDLTEKPWVNVLLCCADDTVALHLKLLAQQQKEVFGLAIANKGLSALDLEQLQYLYWGLTKGAAVPPEEYQELIRATLAQLNELALDATTASELHRRVELFCPPTAPTIAAEIAPPPEKKKRARRSKKEPTPDVVVEPETDGFARPPIPASQALQSLADSLGMQPEQAVQFIIPSAPAHGFTLPEQKIVDEIAESYEQAQEALLTPWASDTANHVVNAVTPPQFGTVAFVCWDIARSLLNYPAWTEDAVGKEYVHRCFVTGIMEDFAEEQYALWKLFNEQVRNSFLPTA